MYKTVHLYAKIVAFLCGLLYKYKPFVQPSKEKPRKMYKTPIKQALLGLFLCPKTTTLGPADQPFE